MPTKAETARANGARSIGPVTAEGKARSSQNSVKHGLSGAAVVLPHESQQDFEELHTSLLQEFRPTGPLQRDLVYEMAAARWRLRRIQEMESAIYLKAIRAQQEKLGPKADPAEVRMLAYAAVADSNALRMVIRYATQIRRAYEKAWTELAKLQRQAAAQEQQNEPSRPVRIAETPRSYIEIYNATLPSAAPSVPMPPLPQPDPRPLP